MNWFLCEQKDDGTYGDPIPLKGVTEFYHTRSRDSERKVISNELVDGFEGTLSCDMDYKAWKNFVWVAILNLKRSRKHLIQKNIWKRGETE